MTAGMVSRVAVAFALEAQANALVHMRDPGRIQPHSRLLPSETELAEVEFAARQLRTAAGDLMAGVDRFGFLPIACAPRDGRRVVIEDSAGNRTEGFWAEAAAGEGWFTIEAESDPPLQPLPFAAVRWTYPELLA